MTLPNLVNSFSKNIFPDTSVAEENFAAVNSERLILTASQSVNRKFFQVEIQYLRREDIY